MVYKQYELLDTPDFTPHCTHSWTKVAGLPCSHVIKERMSAPECILYIEDVHPHWRFTKPDVPAILSIDQVVTALLIQPSDIDPILLIQEPTVARTRGRPMGAIVELPSMEESSTQRNPSGFERVEGTIPVRRSVATRGRVATRGTRRRGNGGAREVRRWVEGRVKGRVKGQVRIEEERRVEERVEGRQAGTEGE